MHAELRAATSPSITVHGWETRYAHLATVTAVVGQRVEIGQSIAIVGSTWSSPNPGHSRIRGRVMLAVERLVVGVRDSRARYQAIRRPYASRAATATGSHTDENGGA